MTAKRAGLEEVIQAVQAALMLPTKREAEILVGVVVSSLEETLLRHLAEDGYSIKLGGFL